MTHSLYNQAKIILFAISVFIGSFYSYQAKAQFTHGNVVVHRVGDGTTTLTSNNSTAVYLDEFSSQLTNQTTPTFTVALPCLSTSVNASARLTESATASTNACLTLSPDGHFIVVSGYDADSGLTSVISSSAARVVDTVDVMGHVGRAASDTAIFTSLFRCAATDDSNNYWGSGNGGGIFYFGNTTTPAQVAPTSYSLHDVKIINGGLYYTSAASTSGGYGIVKLGSGLPKTSGQTPAIFLQTGTSTTTTSPYDFEFNSAMTICYVADTRTTAKGGGVQKWVLNGSTWTLAYTISTGTTVGAFTVAADFSGTYPIVYAVTDSFSSNSLLKIIDSSTNVANNPVLVLATAAPGEYFRGVSLSPGTCSFPTPLPAMTITPSSAAAICIGGSTTLTASGANSYSWAPATGLSTTTGAAVTATPTATTTYTVTGTDIHGCVNTLSKSVKVNPLPTIAISPSTSLLICAGTSTALAASGGATYAWTPSASLSAATGATVNASPTVATTYTVTGTDTNGCISTATKSIAVNPAPAVTTTITGATVSCTTGSTTVCLPTASGVTYTWHNGATLLGNTTSCLGITSSGNYTGTATITATGCSATSSIIPVSYGAPIIATTTPLGPVSICPGGSVRLVTNSATGLIYKWYKNGTLITGATDSFYYASTAGSYSDSVSISPTCGTLSNTIVATISSLPIDTIAITGNTTFCQGKSVILTAPPATGNTYMWQKNGTIVSTATNGADTISTAGSYNVIVTNANGCKDTSAAQTVTVNALPVATVTASGPLTFCANNSVTLTAASVIGNSYQWLNSGAAISGAIDSTLIINTAGTYSVKVTNSSSCSDTSVVKTIVVNPLPVPVISSNGVVLSTTTFTKYSWSLNGTPITGAASQQFIPTLGGDYTVTVTNSYGCTGTSASFHFSVGVPIVNMAGQINIYPNPAQDWLTIQSPIAVNVQITDMLGRSVLRAQNAAKINIAGLVDAVYLITIFDSNNLPIVTKRFVKTSL